MASSLLSFRSMEEPERIVRKVTVEESGTPVSQKQNVPMLAILALIVIGIVVFIFLQVR